MGSNLNKLLIMAMCLLMVSAVGSKKVIGYYKSKYDTMVEELQSENSSLKLKLRQYTEIGIPVSNYVPTSTTSN